MIKIIFNGIGGRIGRAMYKLLINDKNYKIVAGVDKFASSEDFPFPIYKTISDVTEYADVIIDFSVPQALDDLLNFAIKNNLKLVIATTGHTEKQLEKIRDASRKIAIFKASNMSLGISMLTNLAKETASFLGKDYNIEIIEQHHNRKVDSPSGTALTIANEINNVFDNKDEFVFGRHDKNCRRKPNEIGIHAIRGGNIVGKHEIMYIGNSEIITLIHESQNKDVFAQGSLRAASFLSDKLCGLYDMNSIIGSMYSVTNVIAEHNISLISIAKIKYNYFIELLNNLASKSINLDMISQNPNADETLSVSFTLPDSDSKNAKIELIKLNIPYKIIQNTSKITSEGAGMAHQCGVARDVLKILKDSDAKVYSITTSETKISCCINNASVKKSVDALNKYYKIK